MNAKATLSLFLVLFSLSALCAQPALYLAESPAPQLPKIAYMALSAALPGAGEMALGKSTKGAILLSTELLAAGMYIKSAADMKNEKAAYKSYAQHYAGVHPDMPQSHYQAVQDYISSEDFNLFQEMMARNYFFIYHNDPAAFAEYMQHNVYSGDESWHWQSEMHWENYKELRRKHQKSKISHTMAFGVMLLNRAISVLDVALTKYPGRFEAGISGTDGLIIGYSLEF